MVDKRTNALTELTDPIGIDRFPVEDQSDTTETKYVEFETIPLNILGVPTGDLSIGLNKVTGLTDGTNPQDAVIKNQLDGKADTVHTHVEADISDLQAYLLNTSGEPLSDLSDVTITSITTGEIIKWNGTAWINNTLSEAGMSDFAKLFKTKTQFLKRTSTTNFLKKTAQTQFITEQLSANTQFTKNKANTRFLKRTGQTKMC